MEESDLLKERLQAITEKHHIQEDIRRKKLDLDQEKLKLQRLKKKSLREQWLLQDTHSNNATDSLQQQSLLFDQHQTRALQLKIHRIEKEVESLEREESMISTNEHLILKRLKVVEKSSEDIIKKAQDSFVSEPLPVTKVIPNVPECLSPPANKQSGPNTHRKSVFAMEINVNKNLLTGERTVVSTAKVHPEGIKQHTGLKVYDDGMKCVYALHSQQVTDDQRSACELSANEVEQLLRCATVHRQAKYHQDHNRRNGHCFYNNQDNTDRGEQFDLRNQREQHSDHVLRNHMAEKEFSCRENYPEAGYQYCCEENGDRRQEERNNLINHTEGHNLGNYNRLGNHYGNDKDGYCGSCKLRNCVQGDQPASHYNNSNSDSWVNGGRTNGCSLPRSRDQEIVSPHQPQLCYTPANYIPLKDYISVDEEKLYWLGHDDPAATIDSGSTDSDRVPSPLYTDDTPYTILNVVDTTEPITAIFMGFQTVQNDNAQAQAFENSLKAELVIIEDNYDNSDDINMKQKRGQLESDSCPNGISVNGNMGHGVGGRERLTERWVGPGIKKIKKKHKHCCTIC